MADTIVGPFHRQYGTVLAAGVNALIQCGIPASAGGFYTSTLAAGDVKVSKDGGAEANITTLPTQIAATGIWSFTLSATELQASVVVIHVKKAGSTNELALLVETRMALGQLKIDSTQIGGNVVALALQGVGTQPGLASTGGATGQGATFTGGATSGAGLAVAAAAGNSVGLSVVGFGTSVGLSVTGGATGGGASIASGGGNTQGLTVAGAGSGNGITVTPGATGIGVAISGGATSGAALALTALGGGSSALTLSGNLAGHGLLATGGLTGHGISLVGGATSGNGLRAVGTAGNSAAATFAGQGTAAGLSATGGATGPGLLATGGATSGSGAKFTATAGNSTGLETIGVGTGFAIDAQTGLINGRLLFVSIRSGTAQAGGAATITLDAGASASNNFYNNQVVLIYSATGAGQARTISSYVGATKVATVDTAWVTNPDATSKFTIVPAASVTAAAIWAATEGAEPTTAIAANAGFGVILQHLKRRMLNKVSQTGTTQTIFKDDSVTTLEVMTCSDDGTTQIKGRAS